MAQGSFEFQIQQSGYQTSLQVTTNLNLIGTRMSGVNNSVKNTIPKFSTINSAVCTVIIKANNSANAQWVLLNDSLSVISTLSESMAVTTSFKTFTRDVMQYIETNNENAGLAISIYCLSFRVKSSSSIIGRRHTLDAYKINMTFTYPTIRVVGTVAGIGGEVVSSTHALDTPIDIHVDTSETCKIEAKPSAGYKFKQWSDGNANAVREVTLSQDVLTEHDTVFRYEAQFEPITYTATFKNYDGTVLQTISIGYGLTPSYSGPTPTKTQDAQYSYAFSGWSPALSSISGDTTYTAQYTATLRKYTVRWYNEDGTLLETDSTEYGKMPTYDGVTPTKASTAQLTYTFKGWHIEVATVKGAIDYYARYTETTRDYAVIWRNYDETVLEYDRTEYGKIPTYDGATPTKPSTVQYSYIFLGWDTTIEEVTRDIVYTAVYSQTVNRYSVEGLVAEGGTVTGGGTYDYGSSATLTAIPDSGYEFVSWSDGHTEPSRTITVTGNVSYTAVFAKVETSKVYCGSKKVSVYCGTKKVSVYCGT